MPVDEPQPLAGRSAVITGAGSGIGRALAQRLSAAGCPVAIADVDELGLESCRASLAGPVLTEVLDVRDTGAVAAFAERVKGWLPRELGAVFNNAGVAVNGPVLDGDPADDQWLHDINFHGVVNGVRAFLPILVAQGSGAIVNTSSVYGLLAVPDHSAYCASKFAVRGYTESLRHELTGTGVRAVVVHPGGVKTNIARNARVRGSDGKSAEQLARAFADSAMTTPERAAEIIHRGLDRGRSRILVGPDAVLVDVLTRVTPTRAQQLIALVERALARRATATATS